jgi:hypothetical protein
MMVELWTRKREMGDGDETDMDDTSGPEKSGVRLTWLGLEDPLSVLLSAGSGLVHAVSVVLATVPVLDPAGNIGLRGNGLTPSKIDDFLSKPSL